jgi:hypothetical protein
MTTTHGTVVWPAGATSVEVDGEFSTVTYVIEAAPAWNANGVWCAAKTHSYFRLTCATPPDAESACDWRANQ